jgi:hypothetical protein
MVEIWSKQNQRKSTWRKGTKRRKKGIFNKIKDAKKRETETQHEEKLWQKEKNRKQKQIVKNIKEKRKIRIDTLQNRKQ